MKIDQTTPATPGLKDVPALVLRELFDRARLLSEAIRGIDDDVRSADEPFPAEPGVKPAEARS